MYISGWWFQPLGVIIPNTWKVIKFMFQTTNQIYIIIHIIYIHSMHDPVANQLTHGQSKYSTAVKWCGLPHVQPVIKIRQGWQMAPSVVMAHEHH